MGDIYISPLQQYNIDITIKDTMKKNPNKSARSKGNKAEALLQRQLEEQGYEVRRTNLSAYPDIIAWSKDELLLIEVKSRTDQPSALSKVKSVFKASAKTLNNVPNWAQVLCYVYISGHWVAFQYVDGIISQIQSIVTEETYG
tara:strand:+ start:191 stop:619 length:429 start_codon:yes stop_codon:yes gene_type:complete